MNEYDKIVQTYLVDYEKKIQDNQEVIINAFVTYYGEEYRNIIISRFHEIKYVYMLVYDQLYQYYNRGLSQKCNQKKMENIKKIIKIKQQNEKIMILTEDKIVRSIVKKQVKENNAHALVFRNSENICYMCLPLVLLDDRIFFHELNHVITSSCCLNIMGKLKNSRIIVQYGLYHNDSQRMRLEELVNHRSSKDILDIFYSLGGNLFETDQNITTVYDLAQNLTESFYCKYKELLKKVRITGDTNLLYQYFDKKEYQNFVNYVVKFTDELIEQEDTKHLFDKVYCIFKQVEKMSIEPKNENIDEFVLSLRSQGHHLKMLK